MASVRGQQTGLRDLGEAAVAGRLSVNLKAHTRFPGRITRNPDIEQLTLMPKDPNDCWREQPFRLTIGSNRSVPICVSHTPSVFLNHGGTPSR